MRRQNSKNIAQNGMKYKREKYINKTRKEYRTGKNTKRRQNSENSAQNGKKYKTEKTA